MVMLDVRVLLLLVTSSLARAAEHNTTLCDVLILGGGLAGVLAEPVAPHMGEVDILATLLMEHHLERLLRAVAVLDQTQY